MNDKYMKVEKFEPCNFRELPNSDMMFNVNWKFTWLPTGKEVETTAIVRKVLKNGTHALCTQPTHVHVPGPGSAHCSPGVHHVCGTSGAQR